MTDITCRTVIMKDNQYFRGTAVFPNGIIQYRFSPNMYDAKGFKSLKKAHDVAKRIGGYVRHIDALNGGVI